MPVDQISPIAPARIRALLLPAGRIRRSRFSSFVDRLGPEHAVRLGDISPDVRPDKSMFSPLAFPNGFILYNLTTSLSPPSHIALSPFETFREPLLVICIADGQEYCGNDASTQESFEHAISSLASEIRAAKAQYSRALIVQLLVFEAPSKRFEDQLPKGTLTVPGLQQSKTTTLKTVMCDISARLVAEMSSFARNVQEQQSITSPLITLQTSARRSEVNVSHTTGSRLDKTLPNIPSRPVTPAANGHTFEMQSTTSSPPASSISGDPPKESQQASISRSSSPFEDPRKHTKWPAERPVGLRESFDDASASAAGISNREETQPITSVDRPASRGTGMAASAERAKTRLKARQGLIVGTLYLQSGRWPDALRELVDYTTRAQTLGDHLWHAKGLENVLITMLLLAWAGFDFQIPRVCYPSDKPSPIRPSSTGSIAMSDIRSSGDSTNSRVLNSLSMVCVEIAQLIVTVYLRAMFFPGEEPPQISFSESVIRLANLISVMQRAGGQLDQKALQLIVLGKAFPRKHSSIASDSASTKAMRSEMLALLFRAFPADEQAGVVSSTDKVIILSGMASVLSFAGLCRKQAFVTRELLLTLIPALIQARKVGAAELGLHPAASLALLQNTVSKRSSTSIRGNKSQDTYAAFTHLMATLCKAFGVGLDGPLAQMLAPTDGFECKPAEISAAILADAAELQSGNRALKVEVLRICVNFSESLPNFTDAIYFSTKLLQTISPLAVSQSLLSASALPLTSEEQTRFALKVYRGGDLLSHNGSRRTKITYWDAFLIRDLQLLDSLHVKTVVKHFKADFDGPRDSANPSGPVMKQEFGPFLHSSLNTALGQLSNEKILVAGEDTNLQVLLQNPFDFDLAIEQLTLIAEGVRVQNQPRSVVVGPRRLESIPLSFIPMSPGELRITGCAVKVAGCDECRFPIFRGSRPFKQEAKIKKSASRPSSLASSAEMNLEEKIGEEWWLPTIETFAVQRAQPLLEVTSTSLSQSTLAVLQGETNSFFITVRNVSDSVAVDFVHLSFTDTLATSSRVTSKARSSAFARYELEYQEIYRQTFKWRRIKQRAFNTIPPGDTATYEIEVFGRPGLGHSNILVDYANLGCTFDEVGTEFYTRRLNIPLTITVNASIQLQRVDTLPIHNDIWPQLSISAVEPQFQAKHSRSRSWIGSDRANTTIPTFEIHNKSAENMVRPSSLFMLLLDFQNACLQPLAVSISSTRTKNEDNEFDNLEKLSESRVVIQPGHVTRVAVPVPKISIDDPYAEVPTLNPANEKQYVVDKDDWPKDVLKAALEAFWFREALLKRVSTTWKETDSDRNGLIDIRGVRLNHTMIQTMIQHELDVHLEVGSVHPTDSRLDNRIKSVGPTTFQVETKTVLTVRAVVRNQSRGDIRGIMRFQPRISGNVSSAQIDLAQRITWTGLLQQPLPRIKPGQKLDRAIGIALLAPGSYEMAVSIERFPSQLRLQSLHPYSSSTSGNDQIIGCSTCKLVAVHE